MPKQMNLNREFIKWFFEEQYPSATSNRAQIHPVTEKAERDYWMHQGYVAVAERMAQDLLDTLADFACAVEGLEPEMLTPSEVYDRARENLYVYTARVLSKEH
jgi:hypothetical protein